MSGHLTPAEVTAALVLLEAVTEADGVSPLSEHVALHLRYGGDPDSRHLLARDGDADGAGRLVGYAHIDVTDAVEGSAAELAVLPEARGHGLASAMVDRLLQESPDGRLRLWAHGQHPAAAALARRLGFRRERVLWQMRRSLLAPLPAPVLPAGIALRSFVPGKDERAWT
ncbi:MAG: GNAT family N-acetyltransferase, partial [Actinobacteria bacterium]|nr:GNAT family N-acetyltransferase [Actinomycetota bacterium]